MTPTILPWIGKDDFSRLQQIIPELKCMAYTEWHDDHKKAVAYREPRNGSTRIPVSLDGFVEWLNKTGQSPHLELLWVYAEAVAGTGSGSLSSKTGPQDKRPPS